MKERSASLFIPAFLVTALLVAVCNYLVFLAVPNERVMGPVQRIFYFHVGAAIASYVIAGVVLVASLGYLATRKDSFDCLNEAASEVGLLLCSIVLSSGMIWGHAAWNTWFRWEPRLVSFLVMWLIFIGLVVLRSFGEPGRTAPHCAVLGILAALSVPLVIFSIHLLPQIAQLHPQVVGNRGLKEPIMLRAMLLCMLGMCLLGGILVWFRYLVADLTRRAERHAHQIS